MFSCYLCEKESCYVTYFCEQCREIKNIMNVYGRAEVLDIVKTCTIRNKKQLNNKIENIKKEQEGEETPVQTRSQKKKDLVKSQ